MSQSYYDAFAVYLQTGNPKTLAPFLEDGAALEVLAVYRNGFYKACIDAVFANFPITKKILSEELFQTIAKEYVDSHPPALSTLVGYGASIPQFLTERLMDERLNLPVIIADIAKLDHSWITSLNGANDEAVLTADTVLEMTESGADPSELYVQLTSTGRIVELNFNAFELWQTIKLSDQVPAQYQLVKLNNQVLMWRLNGEVVGKPLTEAEIFFFNAIHEKSWLLGELVQETVEKFPSFDVAEHFSQCLQNSILTFEKANSIKNSERDV
jgi:hypothetical protein